MKKKKLKIALVSDAIYPYNKGGKEKRIYEISTRLAKAGHEVHIYCMKWWKGKSNQRIENGVYLHAISPLYPLYSGQRRSIRQALLFSLACFKLIKEDFDIIEVDHMPHFVLFSTKVVTFLKGKKLYATWNEVWGRKYWNEYLGKLGDIAYIIEWISAHMPDRIVAVSKHTEKKLRDDLNIKNQITIVSNGIDLKLIQGIKPSKEKSDIIFAGRLLKNKNVDILIKSVSLLKKYLPKIKVYIIGDGPEKAYLQKFVKDLALENNVKFFGFLKEHNELYALMKSSKIFVFPSTREGFGIAALEANASGIPVLTVDHQDNATKDLIQNGKNGYVVELNERIITKIVLNALSKKNNYDQIKFIKNYDWDTIAHKLEEVYLQ